MQDMTSGSVNQYISDRIPIFSVYKKERAQHKRKPVTGRSYKTYNKDSLSKHIKDCRPTPAAMRCVNKPFL